jgi:polysaccharide chain length determinant protein (PEP-CTERM system associated)
VNAPLLQTLKELSRDLWLRRWLAVSVAWAIAVLVIAIVIMRPDRYEATARIYIDTQTVLKPLMAGLAFQPDTDQQVRMLARTLVSRPNVEQLRKSPQIGWEASDPTKFDREVDELMSRIVIAPSGSGNIYAISYRDTHPVRAERLVSNLVKTFVDMSGVNKRKDSQDARKFIDDEIHVYETKLIASENALKDFKVKNFGISGVPTQDYFMRVSTLTDEVNKLQMDLGAAEQVRDSLRRELSSEEPQLPREALPNQPFLLVSELESRLDIQKRQLDDLLRRFTDEHPDVLSARKAIAQLEAQKKADRESRRRGDTSKVNSAATNPVFQKIRFALAEAEANIASLRVRLGTQRSRLDQVQALASRAPQAEAELSQLNRDYEVLRKNYEQLVSRRESASLGVKIDESASLAEFRIIDPPRTNSRPVAPSRMMMALGGAALAVAAGIGAALLMGRFRPVVNSVQLLRQLSGRPVLGVVSVLQTPEKLRKTQLDLMGLGSALGLFCLVQGVWLIWLLNHTRT